MGIEQRAEPLLRGDKSTTRIQEDLLTQFLSEESTSLRTAWAEVASLTGERQELLTLAGWITYSAEAAVKQATVQKLLYAL